MTVVEVDPTLLRKPVPAPAPMTQGLCFTVFPGERHGWVVIIDGMDAERHEFVDRRLALDYAKSWAAGNRPSTLRVLDDMGAQTQGWTFS
jgi:hypothetical protein